MQTVTILRTLFIVLILTGAKNHKLMGQEHPYTADQLMGIAPIDIVGNDYLSKMNKATAKAFEAMKNAASKDGIELQVVSAFRSFDRQKAIYERKYRKYVDQGLTPEQAVEKIIEYSTIPGTSRHHWGTDLDLIDGKPEAPNAVLEPEHFYGDGVFCPMREWMQQHAHDYGFVEVYTNHPQRSGFNHEPWHYSYAPLAIPYLRKFILLDLEQVISKASLLGGTVLDSNFLKRYKTAHILDINPKLL